MPTEAELQAAIKTILSATDWDSSEAIAEGDLFRRVINFANSGRPEGLPGSRVLDQGGKRFTVITEDTAKLQDQLKRDLSAIAAGTLTATRLGQLRLGAGRQVIVPVVGSASPKTGMRMLYRYLPLAEKLGEVALQGTLSHVLLRIYSDPKLTEDLRQCQAPGCDRLFLKSDHVQDPTAPGRRRHRYCSDEHMRQAQNGTSAARTRRWREKEAAARPAAKHK